MSLRPFIKINSQSKGGYSNPFKSVLECMGNFNMSFQCTDSIVPTQYSCSFKGLHSDPGDGSCTSWFVSNLLWNAPSITSQPSADVADKNCDDFPAG